MCTNSDLENRNVPEEIGRHHFPEHWEFHHPKLKELLAKTGTRIGINWLETLKKVILDAPADVVQLTMLCLHCEDPSTREAAVKFFYQLPTILTEDNQPLLEAVLGEHASFRQEYKIRKRVNAEVEAQATQHEKQLEVKDAEIARLKEENAQLRSQRKEPAYREPAQLDPYEKALQFFGINRSYFDKLSPEEKSRLCTGLRRGMLQAFHPDRYEGEPVLKKIMTFKSQEINDALDEIKKRWNL